MATIAGLVVEISANAQKFYKATEGIRKSAQRFGNQVKNIIAGAFQKAALAAGAALASIPVIVGLAASNMRQLQKDAEAVGTTAASLRNWQVAAEDMGIASDKVGDVFKDVQDKVNDFITTGGGEAADVFEKLGLNARDFIGLAPDQALLRINKAMEGLTQGEKIFFMESIADDASRLIPLLRDNQAEFKRLTEQGKEWGLILTGAERQALTSFGETQSAMFRMARGFKNVLSASLAPTFQTIMEWIQDLADGFGGPRQAAEDMGEAIKSAVRSAVGAVQTMLGYLDKVYGILLKVQEFQFKTEAFAATINNIATGSDELPSAFMRLQENQAEQRRLANGETGLGAAQARVGNLGERLAPATAELERTAINMATIIGNEVESRDATTAALRRLGDAADDLAEKFQPMINQNVEDILGRAGKGATVDAQGQLRDAWGNFLPTLQRELEAEVGKQQNDFTTTQNLQSGLESLIGRGAGGIGTFSSITPSSMTSAQAANAAASGMSGGQGGKSVGTLTINVTGEKSGNLDVQGEESRLKWLADALSGAAAAV